MMELINYDFISQSALSVKFVRKHGTQIIMMELINYDLCFAKQKICAHLENHKNQCANPLQQQAANS
jgi:hypothetical protein